MTSQLLTREGRVVGQLLTVEGGVAAGEVDEVVLGGGGEAVIPAAFLVQGAVGTRLLQDSLLCTLLHSYILIILIYCTFVSRRIVI